MKILMQHSRKGTIDGFAVRQFLAGRVYDVPAHLAYDFIARGFAVNPLDTTLYKE